MDGIQSSASFDKCLKVLTIFIGTTLFTGSLSHTCRMQRYLTCYIRDVKMQNIRLTSKGVLKIGKPNTTSCRQSSKAPAMNVAKA